MTNVAPSAVPLAVYTKLAVNPLALLIVSGVVKNACALDPPADVVDLKLEDAKDPKGAATVNLVALAHVMGMDVVAEDIKTTSHLGLLKQLGCEYDQGYLFAKPMLAGAVEAMFATRNIYWH